MENEYRVESVDNQDALGIADTLVRAMSLEEQYTALFKGIPLLELIDDTLKRVPSNLSAQRSYKRHQKVVHVKTGKLVAYARWVLPESVAGDITWSEAQTRQPTDEEKKLFKQDFDSNMDNGKRKIQNNEITHGPLGAEKGDCFDELAKDRNSFGTNTFSRVGMFNYCPRASTKRYCNTTSRKWHGTSPKAEYERNFMSTAAGLAFYKKRGFQLVCTISQDFSKWGISTPRVTGFLMKEISIPDQVDEAE